MSDVKAVVLLSGGLDSTTLATKAAKDYGPENVLALSLYYGQKHDIEVRAAKEVAKALGIQHRTELIPHLFGNSGSSLTNRNLSVPQTSYEEMKKQVGPGSTYVPFRNGIFLSVAAALALVEGASVLFIGAHAEDAHNWAYPDCTPEFNDAMGVAIYHGTYEKVRLCVPFQLMDKKNVVRLAAEYHAPVHLTRSCYNGREKACGTCPTCVERIAAFERAGYIDPIEYEIPIAWSSFCEPWEVQK